jgi:MSHA biogenesis protein MshQ
MKTLRFSCIAWLIVACIVTNLRAGDYVNTVLGIPNLLGYWRFDSVFQTNSLVNGYTGMLHGNAQLGAPGSGCPLSSDPQDQALVLDGNNSNPSYLSTSLTGQIASQGSVLIWVYLTNQPSAAGHFFQITSQAQSGNDFDFQIQTDNRTYFFTDSGGSTIYNQPLSLNQWHFLAATFIANSTRCIYLDGQLVATSTAGAHSVNSNPLWIGNNSVFGPRCFQGSIDEVAVFNRALSASEVASVYAAAGIQPHLSIAPLNNAVLLTWPTNFQGFTVQTNGTLTNANWATFTTSYGILNTNYAVTNVTGPSSLFYRLAK